MRRRAGLVLVAAGLLLPAAPAAASIGTVAVHADGGVTFVQLDDSSPTRGWDVVNQEYDDDGTAVDVVSGWSVQAVLGYAGIAIQHVRAVRVVGHGSNTSFDLAPGDLADPSPFYDNRRPAIWNNGSTVYSILPQPQDRLRHVSQPQARPGEPLAVYVQDGPDHPVTISPGQQRVDVGKGAAFTASTAACGGGSRPAVSWDFGDGTNGDGTSVTHAYVTSGAYTVVAQASCAADGSAGMSNVAQVAVRGPQPTATATPAAPGPGGGGSTNPKAPVTGPAAGNGNVGGVAPSTARPSASSTKTGRAGGRPPHAAAPTRTPAPAAPPPAAATTARATSPRGQGPSRAATRGTPAGRRARRRTAPKAPGATIAGRVIAALDPVPAAALATPAVAATAPAARLAASATPGLGGVAGGAGAVLLLGAGAAKEILGRRKRGL
jgi:hypothetical protein